MAFHITKVEAARREAYAIELNAKQAALEDAVNAYNEAVSALRGPVETALATYNETLGEVRGFCEDIASEHQGRFDDKSERWQEGEKGQAAQEFISEWENIDLSEIEIEWPEDFTIDAPAHADDFEGLPSEAQQ